MDKVGVEEEEVEGEDEGVAEEAKEVEEVKRRSIAHTKAVI